MHGYLPRRASAPLNLTWCYQTRRAASPSPPQLLAGVAGVAAGAVHKPVASAGQEEAHAKAQADAWAAGRRWREYSQRPHSAATRLWTEPSSPAAVHDAVTQSMHCFGLWHTVV